MKTLGMKLNLKGHWAGVPSHASQKKFLHMPCDIEGHKGTVSVQILISKTNFKQNLTS